MTGKLVGENLKHRPMRSLLSTLLIGVPVTLILCLVGLTHGLIDENTKRTQGIGADVMVRPPGSSIVSLSGGIDERVVGRLVRVAVDPGRAVGERLDEREMRRLVVARRMLEQSGRKAHGDDRKQLERPPPPGHRGRRPWLRSRPWPVQRLRWHSAGFSQGRARCTVRP